MLHRSVLIFPKGLLVLACLLLPLVTCGGGNTAFQAATTSTAIAASTPATAPPNQPAALAAATDPVLYFSDIVSGPKAGNSDTSGGRTGEDGAIVTIWGRNLGGTQGSSKVYANGAEAASTYSWGNAAAPADLYTYHQMQMISFQVSHLAQDGVGQIYIVINGKQSNSLPFSVRAGNIYFAKTSGSDDTGDGSWGNPWQTIPKAADSLAAGDIAYIGNGVDQVTETNYGAAVNLGSDGAEGSPKALIVYPGRKSCNTNCSFCSPGWF